VSIEVIADTIFKMLRAKTHERFVMVKVIMQCFTPNTDAPVPSVYQKQTTMTGWNVYPNLFS
jgi:hypothetical protein